jgi:hypothetical protein
MRILPKDLHVGKSENCLLFGQRIEIFSGIKFQLFHFLGIDTDSDRPHPDRYDLDADPDPEPAK